MGRYERYSDDDLFEELEHTTYDAPEIEYELEERGYIQDKYGVWVLAPNAVGGCSPFFIGILVFCVLGFVGLFYVHVFVAWAWFSTDEVSVIFIIGLLLLIVGKGRSTLGSIVFYLCTVPLATRFFPYLIGDEYIAWFTNDDHLGGGNLIKYGIYLLLYQLAVGITLTIIGNKLIQRYLPIENN